MTGRHRHSHKLPPARSSDPRPVSGRRGLIPAALAGPPTSTARPGLTPGGVDEGISVRPAGLPLRQRLNAWTAFAFPRTATRRATRRRSERHIQVWPALIRGDKGHEHQERGHA